MKPSAITVRVHERIGELAELWPRLEGLEDAPFSRLPFLEALEASGCVNPDAGWLPHHLSLWDGDAPLGVAPAYLKGHSQGEFVFDHGWANAAPRFGVEYFPKLLVAVPFTPAGGPRLYTVRGADAAAAEAAFAGALAALVERMGLSSAHVNFLPGAAAESLARRGFVHRHGLQFHFHARGAKSFEEVLARLPSKRRTQLRRERRAHVEQGITIRTHTGSELVPEVVDAMFDFYLSTVDKFVWGRRYLNRAFFETVCSTMGDAVEVVLARDASGKPIAGAFNLRGARTLFGRHWGARSEVPFLHFSVCYYHGIERCLEQGLERFEPGAGGEHKLARGFEPTVTHSVHWIENPRFRAAIEDACRREREAIALELGEVPYRAG